MGNIKGLVGVLFFLLLAGLSVGAVSAQEQTQLSTDAASERVRSAVEYWRGESSEMLAKMLVHRPDWQRVSKLRTWTKGTKYSLVRFIAPKKDAGNASLTVENDMWTFTPKTRRAIKIPASMKGQSWMGSDFSYQDLSKDDEIIDHYNHRLLRTEEQDSQKVYVIEAIPKEAAPVVWGKEIVKIRDDNIILEHTYYDQDGVAVKQLRATEIGMLGGKLYPIVIRMSNLENEEEWTEVRHLEAEFDVDVQESFFVVGTLTRM